MTVLGLDKQVSIFLETLLVIPYQFAILALYNLSRPD